jgi:hypothetical protein
MKPRAPNSADLTTSASADDIDIDHIGESTTHIAISGKNLLITLKKTDILGYSVSFENSQFLIYCTSGTHRISFNFIKQATDAWELLNSLITE